MFEISNLDDDDNSHNWMAATIISILRKINTAAVYVSAAMDDVLTNPE